jgi:hypothetical protein
MDQDKKHTLLECRWYNLPLDRAINKVKAGIKVCFCPQKRMSPPVPQTVVIGKKYIWVTNKIKFQ